MRLWPEHTSVDPGATLRLRVVAPPPRYTVTLVRTGDRLRAAGPAHGPFAGERAEIVLPATFPPGAYLAYAADAAAQDAPRVGDAREGAALVVVRAPAAAIAVNLPLFTYHAYNVVAPGGDCLYTGPTRVALQRPGGGIGGFTWDDGHVDVYDPSSPRQTFAHWDAKAIAWLEARGVAPAIVTDRDLHDGTLPHGLRLLLAFGHQEYWTRAMRARIASLLARGTHVAFFSGNTSWFRIRLDAERDEIVRDGKWSDDEPEAALLGTSYRYGGGRWRGPRPPTGYTVRDASHWVFARTGLRDGETFGAAQRLLGYECDATPEAADPHAIATARLDGWDANDGCGEVMDGRASFVIRETPLATLVNAATVDWARVMQRDAVVDRITRNVVERLGGVRLRT